MSTNLDDRLINSGLIPSIGPNEVIEVNPGLLLDGAPIGPNIVEPGGGVQWLQNNPVDGWMVLWNPDPNNPVEGVRWIAKHIHTIEGNPDEIQAHQQRESAIVPPTWYPIII